MKKILLSLIAVLLSAASASAIYVEYTYDFTYTYRGKTLKYKICRATASTCDLPRQDKISGNLIIPEKASDGSKEYTVVGIGNLVFDGYINLTSVTIPNSVNYIGVEAFNSCSGLTSVTIPNSVTRIEENAFNRCSGLTKAEFASIESLCKIYFQNNFANPLGYAHNLYINGKEIKDLVIPESVTTIKRSAFYGCSGLTSVTIPNSVTSIGESAFEGCIGMTSVTTPNSVTAIDDYAFRGCSGLTSVSIPNSVTAIGDYAFDGCSGLTEVEYLSETPCTANENIFSSEIYDNATLIIPEGMTDVYMETTPWNLFKNIVEEGSLSAIGHEFTYTYEGQTLKYIVTDNIAKTCKVAARQWPKGKVIVPEVALDGTDEYTVTEFGALSFEYAEHMTSITIPATVTKMGGNSFRDWFSLTEIYYLSKNPCSGTGIFYTDEGSLEDITLYIPRGTLDIYMNTVPWCYFTNIIEIEDSLSSIEDVVTGFDDTKSIDYSAPYDVYNLQGIRVAGSTNDLTPGIYIIRQGIKTAKIVIK